MPKKFVIKDEDGKQFEITEETTDEDVVEDDDTDKKVDTTATDEESLTSDEIAALKELAKRSADIIKLLDVEKKEHEATDDADETETDEEVTDEDMCDDDTEEEVIETKTGDSKKSVGSIEKKKVKNTDSIENRETDIADAWSKRYKKSYEKGE